jgi:galactoside O-acetyltransferase
MAFLTDSQVKDLGFASVGHDVQISERAVFYNCSKIVIGSHVRIDDFVVISAGEGGIHIGNYVHIAIFCSLMGADQITLADYSGLSSRVSIYSSNDDYTGQFMTNPTVPIALRRVRQAPVALKKHVIVGSGSVILPGAVLEEGVAIGALSLVKERCEKFAIYAGQPAKRIGTRLDSLLTLQHQLEAGTQKN